MNEQKIENELNLALEATQEEREKSITLETGYDAQERTWEIIVRYVGDLSKIAQESVQVTELMNGYAILVVPESKLEQVAALSEVIYIEKPKRLYFARTEGKRASCMTSVQRAPLQLSGRGVLVAVLDSGVDYFHQEFRKEDGSSRILALWDQSGIGEPPKGYSIGVEYTQEELNLSLRENTSVLSQDLSGHGTGVLGIVAGNGGVAYESELLVVKLDNPKENGFPRTTELMLGINYVVQKAMEYGMPLAINLSFGNTYGSHTGNSLLETYIDDMSAVWKNVICVGSGNEGAAAGHTSGILEEGTIQNVEFVVSSYETILNIQLWKNYEDQFDIYLTHPNGTTIGPFYELSQAQRYRLGDTQILLYYGEPAPYRGNQEIYIEFLPNDLYIDSGIWSLRLVPNRIVEGSWQMWLPSQSVLGRGTRFLNPSEENTLTIPSTASQVITVGAYQTNIDAYADFSGRGTSGNGLQKPSLVAPGVNIFTSAPGNGYQRVSGTSFATPFVTGAAALLMQYGVVDGNDPFLYGEKVKAYLQRGARPLPAFGEYPNSVVGDYENIVFHKI